MYRKSLIAAVILGSALVARPAVAQCSGVDSCNTTNTASVTIGALVNLGMSSTTTTLTAPGLADLGSTVANAGPTFLIDANQDWTLSLKSGNTTNFTYVGSKGGVKAMGDLTWSSAIGGTFVGITASDAVLVSGVAASNDLAAAVFFRTAYAADVSAVGNRPGAYSLPVIFTLSAP